MDQATQQLNENLSRGHKEYESKIKNVEGILSKLSGILDTSKYISELNQIKNDLKNDPSFQNKMTFDNFQMDYEEYIYSKYSKRLDELAIKMEKESLPFYELQKLCEKINILLKDISVENISEIIELTIRLIDSVNELNTHNKIEKNRIIDYSYETIYKVIMYEEIFERSDILNYINKLNVKVNIENLGRLLSRDLDKLDKIDLIDEDLRTLKTHGLGYDYLDENIIKKISRKTVGEANSEYQEKKRSVINELENKIQNLSDENINLKSTQTESKLRLKRLYGKKYLLMTKMLSLVLVPVVTISAGTLLGKKASEGITEYKTITRTVNPKTGEIVGTVLEEYDENETTYVATIMVESPWRKNSTGVGYVRTITAYEYITPENVSDTFHATIEDLEGNMVEKYKYVEAKDNLDETDSLTDSTILITETYQDKNITKPSEKYMVPFAVTSACIAIAIDILLIIKRNDTKEMYDEVMEEIQNEKLTEEQIKEKLLDLRERVIKVQEEYNNAVKKYGSLADQFVFDEVDTKWIKEYTKSLKRR